MATNAINTKCEKCENKIPDTSCSVTTNVFNTKIGEVKNKVPDVSGLVKETFITLKY